MAGHVASGRPVHDHGHLPAILRSGVMAANKKRGTERHTDTDPLQSKSDERQLWAAVIQQQLEDATSVHVSGARNPEHGDEMRAEARAWLTKPNPDFDEAVYLAGLEPHQVRKAAIEKIAEF